MSSWHQLLFVSLMWCCNFVVVVVVVVVIDVIVLMLLLCWCYVVFMLLLCHTVAWIVPISLSVYFSIKFQTDRQTDRDTTRGPIRPKNTMFFFTVGFPYVQNVCWETLHTILLSLSLIYKSLGPIHSPGKCIFIINFVSIGEIKKTQDRMSWNILVENVFTVFIVIVILAQTL